MANSFSVFIEGRPAKKGSVRSFGKALPDGSVKTWTVNMDSRAKGWEKQVRIAVKEHFEREGFVVPDLAGPVRLHLEFRLHRPKNHYRTGRFERELRDDAPRFHIVVPDSDKMERSAKDALTGIAYRDDSQVCSTIHDKVWVDRWTAQEGCLIEVSYLTQQGV